ncbi:MAG: hypothetical protein BGO13_13960 [Burkholderiales bacterium 66-5]|nr:MAG: hypothetical protein BGO13_13960 [Burkholderiales bacterium 66-5]
MKMTVLSSGIASPHAGWLAIDELAYLLAHYFGAELLSPAILPDSALRKLIGRERLRFAPIESRGGDVLMVVAHGPIDLAMAASISNVRKKFSKIYGFVTDSYFTHGYPRETALYDAITVTAHEDTAYPAKKFGIQVTQLYQGTDALRWAPREEQLRAIDLIAYGRTPPSYHAFFSRHFHQPDSPYIYLHSPLGHQTGPDVLQERGMLFKLLHRTQISLAFHMFVEPQGNRPRSMMVTSRWLESLLAGCIVAGKRPVSRMAEEMLFWDNATLELADEPEQAHEQILWHLNRKDDLEDQRIHNTRNVIENHDWRFRIKDICEKFKWEIPRILNSDIDNLSLLAEKFSR